MAEKKKNAEVFSGSKWIWASGLNDGESAVVIFRKTFKIDKLPKTAVAHIAAENRYFLSVNGKTAVFDGGLLRVSRPGIGFYDSVDIADMLIKGDNVISVVVVYYGEGNDTALNLGGLLFECAPLGIVSNATFNALHDDSYSACPVSVTTHCSGIAVKYDAQRERNIVGYQKAEFSSGLFEPVIEQGEYGAEPWGMLAPNPLPLRRYKLTERSRRPEKKAGVLSGDRYADVYTVSLPKAATIYPRFTVTALGGEKIEIKTDRYESEGCYSDEEKLYSNFKFEYICKAESQTFEFPQSLHGEKLIFTMPNTVKITALGYRESEYGSDMSGYFRCDDDMVNRLYEKCVSTLACCMKETFEDAPERGGVLFPAVSSCGADAASYIYKDGGLPLVKKALADMLHLTENEVEYSNIYGGKKEVPSQMLIALSELGLLSAYYAYTGADNLVDKFSSAALNYLMKWEMGEDGLIVRNKGEKTECDKLYNCDRRITINMLYFSALQNIAFLRRQCGDNSVEEQLTKRAESILEALQSRYDGTGFTAMPPRYDERANALAILTGVALPEQYDGIVSILSSVHNATPLYEGYVLAALAKAGRGDIAVDRMKSRYFNLTDDEDSTLYEDFSRRGARCYLGSVAPISLLYRYIAGVKFDHGSNGITLVPDLRRFNSIEFGVDLKGGKLSGKIVNNKSKDRVEIVVDNATGKTVTLVLKSDNIGRDIDGLPEKAVELSRGRTKITV